MGQPQEGDRHSNLRTGSSSLPLLDVFIRISQSIEDDTLFGLTFLGNFEKMVGINLSAFKWGHGFGETC